MTLHRSPLYTIAATGGSEFIERYGWELPAAYTDPGSEYQSATTAVAVYDASHMGRLKITGDDALDLLNRLSTNMVADLEPGQGAPTILTTDRGRILDVIIVLNAGDHTLLLTSPGTQQSVIKFLDRYTIMEDLTVEDVSSSTAMLALWGPDSGAFLEKAIGAAICALPLNHTLLADVGGCQVRVVACSMSDLLGFYLICPTGAAEPVWQQLVDAGAAPMGNEAYEAVRVRYGVPVHGSEMGEDYNPLEAGLIGSIDFTKGCYIGQEVIARLDTYEKVQKYLVKLAFAPGAEVAPGTILQSEGKAVGKVTSVATDPSTGEVIGLAYVRTQLGVVGTRLQLEPLSGDWAEIQGLPQLFGPEQG